MMNCHLRVIDVLEHLPCDSSELVNIHKNNRVPYQQTHLSQWVIVDVERFTAEDDQQERFYVYFAKNTKRVESKWKPIQAYRVPVFYMDCGSDDDELAIYKPCVRAIYGESLVYLESELLSYDGHELDVTLHNEVAAEVVTYSSSTIETNWSPTE